MFIFRPGDQSGFSALALVWRIDNRRDLIWYVISTCRICWKYCLVKPLHESVQRDNSADDDNTSDHLSNCSASCRMVARPARTPDLQCLENKKEGISKTSSAAIRHNSTMPNHPILHSDTRIFLRHGITIRSISFESGKTWKNLKTNSIPRNFIENLIKNISSRPSAAAQLLPDPKLLVAGKNAYRHARNFNRR